jgi:hypothetical protein
MAGLSHVLFRRGSVLDKSKMRLSDRGRGEEDILQSADVTEGRIRRRYRCSKERLSRLPSRTILESLPDWMVSCSSSLV